MRDVIICAAGARPRSYQCVTNVTRFRNRAVKPDSYVAFHLLLFSEKCFYDTSILS